MALNWNFKTDKIGTWERKHPCGENVTYNLYSGNALLIACYEYEENGQNMYFVNDFFCNKDHMKNCLGLTNGYENIYNDIENSVLTLYADYRYTKDIVAAFAKANFDNEITIKIIPKAPF